jgi:hypothetical protein
MLDELFKISWITCIDDIKEIGSVRLLSIEVFIREVSDYVVIIPDEFNYIGDLELSDLRDRDVSDLCYHKEEFLSLEQQLEKVLVKMRRRW